MAIRSTTPVKPASLPIGTWNGASRPLRRFWQRLERAVEVGALAVEAVDDDDARQPVLVGELPDLLRLHLHARHRVDHHDGGARHAEPGAGVGDEIAVPGRVDQVEAMALVVAEGHRGVQRDLALDLVGIEIGGGGAVVDLAEARGRARGQENRLDERRLAHPAVTDDRDVANLGDVLSHACPSLIRLAEKTANAGRRMMFGDATTARRGLPGPGTGLRQTFDSVAPRQTSSGHGAVTSAVRRSGAGGETAPRRATTVGRPCSRGCRCPRPRPRCGRRRGGRCRWPRPRPRGSRWR